MGDKSGIEWTDATWNPVTGCSKVSQGCKNCYALRDWARLSANKGSVYYGRAFTDVQCHEERLGIPLTWTKPRRIFVNSMSDLFHAAVPDAFILRVLETMQLTARHTYQVLTKRADRLHCFFREHEVPPNCHVGVSVEDQATWDERAPFLIGLEARVRFVSFEPLLGPIDTRGGVRGIQWAIVGGESGPAARPTQADWARSLAYQCRTAGTPFFFKQWGEWIPGGQLPGEEERELRDGGVKVHRFENGREALRAGKKRAGRLLDGRQHDGYPTEPA